MEGSYSHNDINIDKPIDMSGMSLTFDLITNAQVGFKLYF